MNKIKYIFAESTPKTTYDTQVEGSYFYGYTFDAVICKDKEVINPQWATAFACFSLSLARRGGVASLLLYYTYLIFSHMPKTRKNASSVQGTCTSTSAHDTSNSTTQSLDLNQIKQVSVHDGLLEAIILLKQARDKINKLTDQEEIRCYTKGCRKLEDMSEELCNYGNVVAEVMALFFAENAEIEIDRQLGESSKK